MAAIHASSRMTPLPQFDILKVPPTQLVIDEDTITHNRPIQTHSGTGPLQFEIDFPLVEYEVPSERYFNTGVQFTLLPDDATKTGAVNEDTWIQNVTPCNYLLHSMFEQVDVTLCNKDITTKNATYPYRAYLEALMGFSSTAKKWSSTECGLV